MRGLSVVQWLGLCGPNSGGPGSIPEWTGTHAATKSSHAAATKDSAWSCMMQPRPSEAK